MRLRQVPILLLRLITVVLPACEPLVSTCAAAVTLNQGSIPDTPCKVRFELYQNNILLPVSLNGGEPMSFIFDTGASVGVVDEGWIHRLGIGSKGSATLSAGGGNIPAEFIEGVVLGLPGLRATNQFLAVTRLDMLPPLFGRDIRGILGNNFIKDYVVEIDYAAAILTFYPAGTRSLSDQSGALPLENRAGIPYVPVQILLAGGESVRGFFELDSGSVGSLSINKPFADAERVLARLPAGRFTEGIGGAGLGGDMRAMDARVDQLRIGKHVLRRPVVSISEDSAGVGNSQEAGFVGGEILRRFTVTLDYRSKRALLKPNRHFREPFETDMSGLELMTAPTDFSRIRVKRVLRGSAAEVAGIKAGDHIVSLDGRPAGKIGLSVLVQMLKRDGASYKLVLNRDDTNQLTTLKLKRVL